MIGRSLLLATAWLSLLTTSFAAFVTLKAPPGDNVSAVKSAPLQMQIAVGATVTDTVSPWMYGSGIETYSHCMYGGLWSNMIFDDGFEDAALGALGGGGGNSWFRAAGGCSVGGVGAFNGNQSLTLASGCKAVNRGLVVPKANGSSIAFVSGQPYEGYLFAASAGKAATVRVSLECAGLGESIGAATSLGHVDLAVSGLAGVWRQYNFTLTPTAPCLRAGAAPSQGLVAVELLAGSTDSSSTVLQLDKLMVEPGAWGRYKGMHIRKDLAEAFLGQGPTMMRLGGSMTNTDGFRFKYMVGKPWLRPPTDSNWIKHTSWDFGMFELLQFGEQAGLRFYLCVNLREDMAGLLEYMYGSTSSTKGGKQRLADGHAKPYSTEIVFVCSNEEPQQRTCSNGKDEYECYVAGFKLWAAATKAAAKKLGIWPLTVGVSLDSGAGRSFNPGSEDPRGGGATEMLAAIKEADLGPVMWDQHGDGGVAAGWNDGVSTLTKSGKRDWLPLLSNVPPSNFSMEALSDGKVKTIMLEENGGGCSLGRALGHVSNSLSFQRFGHQMVAQSAAGIFWPGAPGATNGDYQVKFLADQVVLAPFAHAQRMLSQSHQPHVLGGFHRFYNPITGAALPLEHTHGPSAFTDWMAARSQDGGTLVIRAENPNANAVALSATLSGGPWVKEVGVVTLSGASLDAHNDYNTPSAVAPVVSKASTDGKVLAASLKPFSFTVFTLTKK